MFERAGYDAAKSRGEKTRTRFSWDFGTVSTRRSPPIPPGCATWKHFPDKRKRIWREQLNANASPHPSNISSLVPDYASRFKKVSQRHFARLISPFSSSSQTYPFANILDRP